MPTLQMEQQKKQRANARTNVQTPKGVLKKGREQNSQNNGTKFQTNESKALSTKEVRPTPTSESKCSQKS